MKDELRGLDEGDQITCQEFKSYRVNMVMNDRLGRLSERGREGGKSRGV